MLPAAFDMEHSHQPPFSRQPDPLESLLGGEHGDGDPTQIAVQSPAKSCKVTANSAVTSKLLLSTALWFAVLLYGLVPSRLDTPEQTRFTHTCVKGGSTGVPSSTSYLPANFEYESALAELTSNSAHNASALLSPHLYLPWAAAPESPQAADPYPELALLVDLCPLLQADSDTYADKFPGYAHVCDASRYALPCPVQATCISSTSLARFTLACNKIQTCKSWWLQHHSQHGVCGCAPLVMNLAYSNQHASQAEQEQGLGCPAAPSWAACVWLLIPLGRLLAH